MTQSLGAKFVAIVFSFIITISFILELVDQTLHENHENWYSRQFKQFKVVICMYPNVRLPIVISVPFGKTSIIILIATHIDLTTWTVPL